MTGFEELQARHHAAGIREYWRKKGYHVRAEAVRSEQQYTDWSGGVGTIKVWTVETDLIDGLPRELAR